MKTTAVAHNTHTSKPWPRGEQSIKYARSFAGVWPNLPEWIDATVCTWDDGWEARCHLGIPNELREQWNTRKVFPTRDEAASYAAAFVLQSEAIVAAMLRGETPAMPHKIMRAACAADLVRSKAVVGARRRLADATTHRERIDARDALAAAERDGELAWYRSHDWRNFVPSERIVSVQQSLFPLERAS